MAFLDGGFDFEFGGRCRVEVVFGIGFEGWLITFEGEDVVGFVGDDLVSDLDLTAHGVDGDQRAFELLWLRHRADLTRSTTAGRFPCLPCARVKFGDEPEHELPAAEVGPDSGGGRFGCGWHRCYSFRSGA